MTSTRRRDPGRSIEKEQSEPTETDPWCYKRKPRLTDRYYQYLERATDIRMDITRLSRRKRITDADKEDFKKLKAALSNAADIYEVLANRERARI